MAVKRTALHKNPGGVLIDPTKGEFLHFTLKASGPVPIFSFESNMKGAICVADDFPDHPATIYEWSHLKDPSDAQQLELLGLALIFLTCKDYEYIVEVRRQEDEAISTVMHIQYSGDGADQGGDSLRVVLHS